MSYSLTEYGLPAGRCMAISASVPPSSERIWLVLPMCQWSRDQW
jgi:hypothetical protein